MHMSVKCIALKSKQLMCFCFALYSEITTWLICMQQLRAHAIRGRAESIIHGREKETIK